MTIEELEKEICEFVQKKFDSPSKRIRLYDSLDDFSPDDVLNMVCELEENYEVDLLSMPYAETVQDLVNVIWGELK